MTEYTFKHPPQARLNLVVISAREFHYRRILIHTRITESVTKNTLKHPSQTRLNVAIVQAPDFSLEHSDIQKKTEFMMEYDSKESNAGTTECEVAQARDFQYRAFRYTRNNTESMTEKTLKHPSQTRPSVAVDKVPAFQF